jgi:1-acyl-sn-glycerol-3-phosphate acyltransferase
LPVTIVGAHESWPPGRILPRPGRLTITFHPVLVPKANSDVKAAARRMAIDVRRVVSSALPAHQQPMGEAVALGEDG